MSLSGTGGRGKKKRSGTRRVRADIYAGIIMAAEEPIAKVDLKYETRLNFQKMMGYLKPMIEKGLVEVIEDETRERSLRINYVQGPNAAEYMELYTQLKKFLE